MSVDLKMAWRNLWRNPRRTILTIAAIAFACLLLVFMLSWQFGSYEAMINAAVKIHTGHLQVQAKGYQEKQSIRQVIADPKAVAALLQKTPGVKHFTFRANAFSLVSSKQRTYGALVVGIDPTREAQVSTLKKIIRKGKYLEPGDENGALLGVLLAKNLQVGLGDDITVLGQGRDGSVAATVLKVKGIYSSGMDNFDRSSIQIGLKNFQDTYTMMGAVHEAVAVCGHLSLVAEAQKFVSAGLKEIKARHPLVVLNWEQLMPGLLQGIEIDMISGLIFYFLLVLVVAFSILNTFLMSIFERMHEFGGAHGHRHHPGPLDQAGAHGIHGPDPGGHRGGHCFGLRGDLVLPEPGHRYLRLVGRFGPIRHFRPDVSPAFFDHRLFGPGRGTRDNLFGRLVPGA